MDSSTESFSQGRALNSSDKNFSEGLKAAVDYRGDVTVSLANGNTIEGYIFNQAADHIDLFPKNSPRAISIHFKDVTSLTFSGEDTASGKTFDDWVKKKEGEKAAIKSQPIEMA